jgi:hypothetical protein
LNFKKKSSIRGPKIINGKLISMMKKNSKIKEKHEKPENILHYFS